MAFRRREDDGKGERQDDATQMMTKIVQLDSKTVYDLLTRITSENAVGTLPQSDQMISLQNYKILDAIGRAIANTIFDNIKGGLAKFSITPSTIDEAYQRIGAYIASELKSFEMKASEMIKADIQRHFSSTNPEERAKVIEDVRKQQNLAYVMVKASELLVHQAVAIIVMNLPNEIGSELLNRLLLGLEKL